MRWQFCCAAARPEPALRVRARARDQAAGCSRSGTRSSSSSTTATSRASSRGFADLEAGPDGELRPLDRWLVARTDQLVAEATAALEAQLTFRLIARLRALRRRPLELVHPAVAPPVLGRRRGGAAHALVRARAVAPRDRPGDAVPGRAPLAEPRRGAVRGRARVDLLAGWPEAGEPSTSRCWPEVAAVRRVVELGRQARSTLGAQAPPAAAAARRSGRELATGTRTRSREELRVKEVEFGEVEAPGCA